MFYKMIAHKRDEWYQSDECTINDLIQYMYNAGQMRDVQIEAIKTYLFLKIKGQCKPLNELFIEGFFNSIDVNELEVSQNTRNYLLTHPAAVALLEYSLLENESGEQVSEKLEKQIRKVPDEIDYSRFFQNVFYNVNYTDYLFSLPMGAGKTYLMAAFIYLDLYFATNEPFNPVFAHNFIIFAPSGLKASVVPSLKTIQRFEPSWVIPEPAATNIKKKLIFEVLDQEKTTNKSNKTKNPNVQKIANHQPLSDVFGLVAVTNAEKVILDRIKEKQGQLSIFDENDDERDRQANELRNLLGKLPHLSIFIDEVHHAVNDEIKLRAVVNRWMENKTVNSVIGFSGTPYLQKVERVEVAKGLSVGTIEITNIVHFYPLIKGVGDFLKKPIVKIETNADSEVIIENGLREFLNTYVNTTYEDGTVAKLGIYCGTIEKLEEIVYPLVSTIAQEYGISSSQILKFHKGNKKYPQPVDSQMQYDMLDYPMSKIRIVLLVQIGKEGWDCRSLTGIILSQEGDCPNNMVLQTSCRCLRQVVKGKVETALIYLNEKNAEKLDKQLQQQHHISIQEIQTVDNEKKTIKRYNRMDRLKLPNVDFYQMKVQYNTLVTEKSKPSEGISNAISNAHNGIGIIRTTDFTMKDGIRSVDDKERGTQVANFNIWINNISKRGFGYPSVDDLFKFSDGLQAIFQKITYEKNGISFFSSKYDTEMIEAAIRKAFHDKRTFKTSEEVIPEEASLLNIENFHEKIRTDKVKDYYPDYIVVEKIIDEDNGKLKPDKKTQQFIELARETNNTQILTALLQQFVSHNNKDRSFHYLPYRTDSKFEQVFLKEVLSLDILEELGLEIYYNGDSSLTEFKIKCYEKINKNWRYVGIYTPDFLIIQRKEDKISKAIIVETKGQIYANDPTFKQKKNFMKEYFVSLNNKQFGYERFEYLYLEDTLSDNDRILKTHDKIKEFFAGGNE